MKISDYELFLIMIDKEIDDVRFQNRDIEDEVGYKLWNLAGAIEEMEATLASLSRRVQKLESAVEK